MDFIETFRRDFGILNTTINGQGPDPLRWQIRLFNKFCVNEVPAVCELPTGLGKTSVIHLWFLALRHQISQNLARLPTRLIYVVDRRTVVDQATEVAERIKGNIRALGLPEHGLAVSTLRGQFADNRAWAEDPSRPAIVIGTVDLIGSRLLFSGYRSSYKQRPLDAGLLGQDALLILDEAHLSTPFEKLVRAISDTGTFQSAQGYPMRVMSMSATSGGNVQPRFELEPSDLEGDEDSNPIVRRYSAKKRLIIESPVERSKFLAKIATATLDLAKCGARVVVFVQKPEDVKKIGETLRKKIGATDRVAELTGTMRGFERNKLLEQPVFKRFLDGDETPSDTATKEAVVLVSTSAGEVGFDLNADHLVCDAAPLDSLIQRLGRVNRRGFGDALVRLFPPEVAEKSGKAKKATSVWETASDGAVGYLRNLDKVGDEFRNASPKAIDSLKRGLTADQLKRASAPKPETVELTPILLDAWSMTTIVKPMPGRPPVAPWIRGITDDEPQTTIAWREELDIEGFEELDLDNVEEWLDSHRVLPHETLSVPSRVAADWIRKRWDNLGDDRRAVLADRCCILERAGLATPKLGQLVEDISRRDESIRGADIVLPSLFGGIERGLLNETADEHLRVDVSDLVDRQKRFRCLMSFSDGVPDRNWLGGTDPSETDLLRLTKLSIELPAGADSARQILSYVPKKERPEFGGDAQALKEHVGLVEKYASEIAERLDLPAVVRESFHLAAKWHDHGKDRERWQRAAGRERGEEPLGKSRGSLRRIAGSYRHEFGSIREFADEHEGKIANDVYDLAMHLIGSHHGRCRPHFPRGGFDPSEPARSHELAVDAIRRFARLQRQYGYWRLAWLENLLRCADAIASSEGGAISER